MNICKKIIGLILMIIFILTFTSCIGDDPFHAKESGDWVYTIDGCEKGHCAILGLSEIGKTKDIIVLPTEIEDLKVVQYGKMSRLKGCSPDIVFDNCKKLYCNCSDVNIRTSFFWGHQEIIGFFPHKFSPISLHLYGSCAENPNATLFLSQDFYNYEKEYYSIDNLNCRIANIEYYLDAENCFFVDNVEKGKLEVIPPKPFRDGYVFNGWYYNDVEWDFNNNVVEDYFDENNRLRIEAKWINA